MKEQDKTPEKKKTKWSGDRQPSRKRIQNNDSEDDLGPQKKNGGKDQEDARNVCNKDLEDLKDKHLEELKNKERDKQHNNWNEKYTKRNQ